MTIINLMIFNAMKLKRIHLILLLTGLIIPFYALPYDGPGRSIDTKASINWKETIYDFGQIKQDIPVTAEFEFENTSLVPLIINSVRATCGCTVANYPKEPVQPGKSAIISVRYNARNPGHFTKTVFVSSNTGEGDTQLVITGEVVK
jgi:hypothetical protein